MRLGLFFAAPAFGTAFLLGGNAVALRSSPPLLGAQSRQFLLSERCASMATCPRKNACLDPATRPELHLANAAAQRRIVSVARIRLASRKSVRSFKGIICANISESAVGTLITECPPQSGRIEARIGLR